MDATEFDHLARAVALARDARERGDHPFGALLVTADGRVVEALNSVNTENDPTGHAETNLVRLAASSVEVEALASSTLFTSTEPCAMCAGDLLVRHRARGLRPVGAGARRAGRRRG